MLNSFMLEKTNNFFIAFLKQLCHKTLFLHLYFFFCLWQVFSGCEYQNILTQFLLLVIGSSFNCFYKAATSWIFSSSLFCLCAASFVVTKNKGFIFSEATRLCTVSWSMSWDASGQARSCITKGAEIQTGKMICTPYELSWNIPKSVTSNDMQNY